MCFTHLLLELPYEVRTITISFHGGERLGQLPKVTRLAQGLDMNLHTLSGSGVLLYHTQRKAQRKTYPSEEKKKNHEQNT